MVSFSFGPMARMETTQLLRAWREGDRGALGQLVPRVFDELTRMTDRAILGDRLSNMLETQALVRECLRLIDADVDWQSRTHFIALAAGQMRRVLVDAPVNALAGDVFALAKALEWLAVMEPRVASVADLVFFGGLNRFEVSQTLGLSLATVEGDWCDAKAWLQRGRLGGRSTPAVPRHAQSEPEWASV